MKTCKICVMNETINEFKVNSEGVCNFCLEWDQQKNDFINLKKEEEINNLENFKNKILNNKQNNYDCVVGLSGGVDSSYVIYLLWKLKLKPIIIHMDNGWNSKISNSNINKILEKTNFDFETLVLNWKEFKDLQKSFLKANVPDIELVTDHAIFAYIINYALKSKIKYIISGVNFATEHSVIPSWGWRKDDFNHIRKIHKIFGNVKLKTYPKMNPFKKIYYEKITKKIEIINLLNLVNYNTSRAKEILIKEFQWENYGGKHHESFFTKFFQGYILPKKFNIDKRILHLSCLIRNNEISREQALDELKMPNLETQKIKEYENFFKKKLSISDEEFNKIMKAEPKKHSDYSVDIFNNFLFKKISIQLKKFL